MKLGVNIDHIATLRNARGGVEPSVVEAGLIAQNAGAVAITTHLREDRRHIKDEDVIKLKEVLDIGINLEMAATNEMQNFATKIKPHSCCIVPERRMELTTEGGLDVYNQKERISNLISVLHEHEIIVSLFIAPETSQVEAAYEVGADYIELHTGAFANAYGTPLETVEFEKLRYAADLAHGLKLKVNAGHGLNYENVSEMHKIPNLEELNIGHSIISRAVFTGLDKAVSDMIKLIS